MTDPKTMKDWILATMDLVASESEKALEDEKSLIHSCLNDPHDYDLYTPDGNWTLEDIEHMARESLYNGPEGNALILRLIEIIRGLTVDRDAKPDV